MRFLKNTVKEKLEKGKPAIGSWINLPCLETVEIMARSGFEFLAIDLEHSAISLELAQKMMMVMEGYGVMPFVRVGENHPTIIKRVLEAGAYGIIVPMVSTLDEAKRAIASVFYPVTGERGVGLSRAQGYGLEFERYRDWYKKNMTLIVQIEHRKAFNELEAILELPQIDATMIGPYDLSGSFGFPGEFGRAEVRAAITRYEMTSRRLKKPFGFHVVQPDQKLFQQKLKTGYTFLAYGIDAILFGRKCQEEVASFQQTAKIRKT